MVLRSIFVFVIVSLFVVDSFGASLLARRAVPEDVEGTNKPTEVCQKTTPCGWAVYTKYTRMIEYFMKNQCECPEGKRCIRTDDDISVAAYVYRCKDGNPKDGNNNS